MFLLLSISSDVALPVTISGWSRLDWEHGPEVRVLQDPTEDQLASALALVSRGEVHSGALLEELPSVDRRWLAYEFWHKLVTDTRVDTGRLEALGWQATARDWYTVWSPPAHVEVGRAEFAAGILQPAARTIEVRVDQDLDDIELFGLLASSRQGGSCALMALSGARPGRDTLALRNPAALDLELLTSADSLAYLAARAAISVSTLGASSDTDVSALDLEAFSDPDAVRRAWNATDHPSGFWLVSQLAAPIDPTVGIPPGHIFEQRTLNGIQTLAAATTKSVVVGVGKPVTLVIPAWCLNQDLAPPNGQPVRPTALRARYSANTSQADVWDHRRQVLSS
jgi:hypothetical protein